MERQFHSVTIQLAKGDITRQPDLDAVINAANAGLMPGGGVAGAIHRAAGAELEAACRPLAPIDPGSAVITPAFSLPNRHVIHCLGPVYGVDEPSDRLLTRCYERALDLAEEAKLGSLGFPAISTGAFAYPKRDAAAIALHVMVQRAPSLSAVRLIRFVLFSDDDLTIHREILAELG
ncbi:macro domain-containing protein [Natronospira bacteriovora]|uniref:Macro domain-containing protein n=1 Tax=Natronospira bacteriovora TaxID=3069753 RepID=A0ABU0W5N4_9GAMM|nr:macro domain-containing protein [Natronospira sp. AB-CW4]MDQ2069233.1 macro domain-containing protein [Natronospira sp. AB-CW4]